MVGSYPHAIAGCPNTLNSQRRPLIGHQKPVPESSSMCPLRIFRPVLKKSVRTKVSSSVNVNRGLRPVSRARSLWRCSILRIERLHRLRRQSLIACGSQVLHSVPAVKIPLSLRAERIPLTCGQRVLSNFRLRASPACGWGAVETSTPAGAPTEISSASTGRNFRFRVARDRRPCGRLIPAGTRLPTTSTPMQMQ
jgi:hypothetical protein